MMDSYSGSYKWLHWSMVGLIFLMFFALLGFNTGLTDAERMTMLVGHSSMGTVITLLILVRISKRFILKHPQPRQEKKSTQATAAKFSHYGLYLLMVLVPLSGYLTASFHELPVMMFGGVNLSMNINPEMFELLRTVHSTSVKTLMAMVILHVAAALMHKFVLKDQVLYRMRPWFGRKAG